MKCHLARSLVVAAVVGCCAVASHAEMRYVWTNSVSDGPGTDWSNAFHTIQGAVDASASGDTVRVTNGVYTSGGGAYASNQSFSRVFVTNAVRVISVNGPENTVIVGEPDPVTSGHGSNAVRGVLLTTGAELSGFSVTGGWTWAAGGATLDRAGGGVQCRGGGLVSDCILENNRANGQGGGFYCTTGGEITNSRIVANAADKGGGAYIRNGRVAECDIAQNTAVTEGAGANCGNGALLENCDISDNTVTNDGGGVFATGSGTVRGCRIRSNRAAGTLGSGGGIHLYYGGLLEHSLVYSNSAKYSGGGVVINSGNGSVNNCLISRNTTLSYGGGMYCYGGGGPVANCTITENHSSYYYGGVNCNNTGVLYNTIIYYNTATTGKGDIGGNLGVAISCCISTSDGLNVFKDCTTQEPAFVDRAGFDYRLLPTSPCRNSGSNSLAEGAYDLSSLPRIMGPGVDMGCYEYCSFSDAIDPPEIVLPVVVPGGGSGVLMVTNLPAVEISGNKDTSVWVAAPWSAFGINQSTGAGQVAWTHAGLDLVSTAGGSTSIHSYASLATDLETYSSNRTTLTIIDYRMPAGVDITNVDGWVSFDVETTTLACSNDAYTVGMLCWTNSLGGAGTFAVTEGMSSAPGVALGVGTNFITVTGTNRLGDITGDSVTITRGAEGTGVPVIGITNAPAWVFCYETQAQVHGTNRNIVGQPWWINDRMPGATNSFSPGFSVQINNLGYGQNEITVYGTNLLGAFASNSVTIYRQNIADLTAATNYVWADNPGTPEPPYLTWTTAATSIQEAVDAAFTGGPTGTVVMVTNGIYRLSSAITLTNMVYVTTVNGAGDTIIDGGFPDTTNRCFMVDHSLAVVEGFTISNAYWTTNGGGAYVGTQGGIFRRCVFIDCAAGEKGGGLYFDRAGMVEQCRFTLCTAGLWGGGIHLEQGGVVSNSIAERCSAVTFGGGMSLYGGGRLYSCLVTNNNANRGGGVYTRYWPGGVYNCTIASNAAVLEGGGLYIREGAECDGSIIWGNTAPINQEYYKYGMIDAFNLCTTPTLGSGCITNDPCFVDAAAGDYRLLPVSPCIDAGVNRSWMNGSVDYAGAPRIMGSTVDIGCYESNPMNDWDGDGMPDGWERQYGLDPTNAADGHDHGDDDGVNNEDEYIADTVPTNSASCFCITGLNHGPPVQIQFLSSSNRVYTLYKCDDLIEAAWSNIPGQVEVQGSGSATYLSDTNIVPRHRSYRLGVALP